MIKTTHKATEIYTHAIQSRLSGEVALLVVTRHTVTHATTKAILKGRGDYEVTTSLKNTGVNQTVRNLAYHIPAMLKTVRVVDDEADRLFNLIAKALLEDIETPYTEALENAGFVITTL